MADFEVKVRNLKTGEVMIASMPDVTTCLEWLKERPPMIEIISVLSDCSPADSQRMREAMRPYDSVERELKARYDAEAAARAQAAYARELQSIQSDQAASAEALEGMDPARPLAVKYDADEGFTVVDDNRELTAAARAACMAWIAERNEWVATKGQLVGEAHLEVWPLEVPDGDESKRVREGGRFFPRLREPEADA